MINYEVSETEKERFQVLADKYFEAVEYEDWESISGLLELNPDIMAEGLALVYHRLPDEYKYSIPTHCYTHNGDHMSTVRKYVRRRGSMCQLKNVSPPE